MNTHMKYKNIYKNLRQAKNFLPLATIELITNGDVLNVTRLKKLLFILRKIK